jgi:short-subunit dehydrogenase
MIRKIAPAKPYVIVDTSSSKGTVVQNGSSAMTDARKTVIVTGASQGIGAGVVKAFLHRGYSVVANSRTITTSGAFEAFATLALVDGSIAEAATAAKIAAVAKGQFGSIDALVNMPASISRSPSPSTRSTICGHS